MLMSYFLSISSKESLKFLILLFKLDSWSEILLQMEVSSWSESESTSSRLSDLGGLLLAFCLFCI